MVVSTVENNLLGGVSHFIFHLIAVVLLILIWLVGRLIVKHVKLIKLRGFLVYLLMLAI